MAKKRLQDMTDRKVMSFKEAAKALNWTLTEDDEVYTVSCDCGNSKIEYTGGIGVQKVRCGNCGKQMSSLISLNPACRSMIDIEKDEEGNERFWIAKFDGFDHGGIVTDKTKVEENRVIPKAAFIQKPLDEGITIEEIAELVGRLECEQVIPIEVQANSSCAIGFISLDAAEELDYDYDNLIRNVSEVIEDMDNETEYGNYDFNGFPVYIGY